MGAFRCCCSLGVLLFFAASLFPRVAMEEEVDEEVDEAFASEVHVAKLEFKRVETVFVVAVFIMVVVVAKLVWHHDLMYVIASNIPESCMLILVGAHIGGIFIGTFYIEKENRDEQPPFRFEPDLFFLFLLPPIVLDSGYFLDNRAFFENFATILVYAIIGTLWNAVVIGLVLFGLYEAGALLVGMDVEFTVSAALLFGTIVAAVDPVAVLAVFDEIHVNRFLHVLVFGESLLNDAVTIVLFKVLGAFANRPFDTTLMDDERDITAADVFLGIGQFIVVVLASVLIGIVVGMLAAFTTRFSEHVHVLEPIIVLTMGYLSYILADLFEFSGIVSLIACAIVMKHYVEANISRKSHTTIKYSLKVLSNVSEMIIFLFLGISLYDVTVHHWDWGLVFWTIFFALLVRPIGVIGLTCILNVFRVRKIDFKSVFVMSYSGLRGAVAFSLALTRIFEEDVLRDPDDPKLRNELSLRRSMLTAVTVLVLFSVFVQGMTIKPLVKRIKVKTADTHKSTMNETIHKSTIDHVMSGMEDIVGQLGHHRIREWIQRIDSKYFRRIFERYPEARDEQILHTFTRLQYQESQEAAAKNLVFEFHEDESHRGSHISVRAGTPVTPVTPVRGLREEAEELTADEYQSLDAEECIPALNDVLAAGFAHPHENHLGHALARHERESNLDHRFEPILSRRTLIERKHKARHARRTRRLRRMLSRGSTLESLAIPEIPEDVHVDPEAEPGAVIPMEDVGRITSREPLSPHTATIESRETDV